MPATASPRAVRHRRARQSRGSTAPRRVAAVGPAPSSERRAARSAEATSGTSSTRMPSTVRGSGAGARRGARPGTTADREAEPGGLGEPLRQVADPAQLAGQADLADGDHALRRRRAAGAAEAMATATARSLAGSVSRAPPTVEAKTSWVCSADAAVLLEHGEHHRDPRASRARTSYAAAARRRAASPAPAPRRAAGGGPPSSPRRRCRAPGWSWCSTNRPVGSVTAVMPSADEVEAADLVDRAEAVLHRADHPEPGVAVALEVEHHVDEVLEHARARRSSRPW